MRSTGLFKSFFIGGFECSTHRRHADSRRLDLIVATHHDRYATADYERLHRVGIHTARDGIRWHLIERPDGAYNWESVIPALRAARATGTQVIWDLLHFGWPDHVDVFEPDFIDRFARFAAAFMAVLMQETDDVPFVAPINEPSFLSFAAGEKGFFYPFAQNRGDEIKAQFVRAIIAGCGAIRQMCPQARIVHTDPIINVLADPRRPQDRMAAEQYRQSQFAVWDIISGRAAPHFGGDPSFLDILGVNYYVHNQWIHNGGVLVPSHPHHLPLRYMLREVYERYERPLFISETGIEAEVRPDWLRYIGHEARAALRLSVPLEGVCIYPIVDHPGWEDDRHCPNGLWGYVDARGEREVCTPLLAELERQQRMLAEGRPATDRGVTGPESDVEAFERIDWNVLNAAARDMEELSVGSTH